MGMIFVCVFGTGMRGIGEDTGMRALRRACGVGPVWSQAPTKRFADDPPLRGVWHSMRRMAIKNFDIFNARWGGMA